MKQISRSFAYFSWLDIILPLSICSLGLLFVFSATYLIKQPFSLFFKKQLCGILTGVILYIIFSYLDHRQLRIWGHHLFLIVIGLLAFTLIKGVIGMGAQRWLDIFFIRFQPAELAKLFLPAFLAYSLHTFKEDPSSYTISDFAPLLASIALSGILILKQPDLGTAVLVVASGLCIIWAAGLSYTTIIMGLLFFIGGLPVLWHNLKQYQKNRIAVFLGGGAAHKERYQTEQALIAIGSGKIIGKGFLQGTQNKFMFLPEGRTDFIFAVACEELGFLGGLLIILFYALLFFRLFFMTLAIENFFDQLICFGLLIHMLLATIINIGMVEGLLPIVGIPLPFFSYGITNLWVSFASLGWINNIYMHQKQLKTF